jgi:hypothetical protein
VVSHGGVEVRAVARFFGKREKKKQQTTAATKQTLDLHKVQVILVSCHHISRCSWSCARVRSPPLL